MYADRKHKELRTVSEHFNVQMMSSQDGLYMYNVHVYTMIRNVQESL